MKYSLLIFILSFIMKTSMAQEGNIWMSEPKKIKELLIKKYPRIEIEVVKLHYRGGEWVPKPGGPEFISFVFSGDSLVKKINVAATGESDTTLYRYDPCGNLRLKKGQGVYAYYKYRYRACKPMSNDLDETEVAGGSAFHQRHLIRYVYRNDGLLDKELISDYEDSLNLKFCNQYAYKNNKTDTLKEFYIDEDGAKILNRATKYFYGNHLDSIHYYSLQYDLIDKVVYRYNASSKPVSIAIGKSEFYQYSYNHLGELETIMDEKGHIRYTAKYFEH